MESQSLGGFRVYLLDRDGAQRRKLVTTLRKWKCAVRTAAEYKDLPEILERWQPSLILASVAAGGLDVLKSVTSGKSRHHPSVVLMAQETQVGEAIEAIKRGARDYLSSPVDLPSLRATLEAIHNDLKRTSSARRLREKLRESPKFGPFVGTSRAMCRVYDLIEKLSATDGISVLITGASGTGKELAARTIHDLSPRAKAPFVAINCGAMPEELIESQLFGHEKGAFTGAEARHKGCFELADGGTLLLDEICEMPYRLQAKLLRVLEDGKVRRIGGKRELSFDVRVLAATNRKPREAVQKKRLREDLFYRLNVFSVALPPLKRRKTDIPLLALHFLEVFNQKHECRIEGFSREVLDILRNHSWPGNVRQLRNAVERAVVLTSQGWIGKSALPPHFQDGMGGAGEQAAAPSRHIVIPVGVTLAEAVKEVVLRTLEVNGNNKSRTARILGVDVKTVRKKVKAYDRAAS